MRRFCLTLFFAIFCFSMFADDIKALISKAEAGNARAQYDLACYYLNSTKSSHIEALRWLRKASKQKYEEADHLINHLIQDGHKSWGDYRLTPEYDLGALSEQEEKDVKQHIIKGHKGNFLILAHSYFHQEKYTLAIYYYKQALTQMRKNNLGRIFKRDDMDYEYEMDFTKACMDAYTMLGFCYEHGYGTQKDLQTAIDYYSLGGILFENHDIAKKYDASGVRKILRECNNPDLYDATYVDFTKPDELGFFYCIYSDMAPNQSAIRPWRKQGILFLKMGKIDIAKDLFIPFDEDNSNKVSEFGCINALWIAEMYYKGLGVPVEYSKAYKLFHKIANEEGGSYGTLTDEYYPDIYADACYRLYECYTYGRGVSKDENKASYYFKEALNNGSTSAIYDDQKRYEISLR